MAAPMTVTVSAVSYTNTTLVALVAVALHTAVGRFRRLWSGSELWIIIADALSALLEEAQTVRWLFKNVAKGGLAGASSARSTNLNRAVRKLRSSARDH